MFHTPITLHNVAPNGAHRADRCGRNKSVDKEIEINNTPHVPHDQAIVARCFPRPLPPPPLAFLPDRSFVALANSRVPGENTALVIAHSYDTIRYGTRVQLHRERGGSAARKVRSPRRLRNSSRARDSSHAG